MEKVKRDADMVTVFQQSESKRFPYIISSGKLGTISIGDGLDSSLRNLGAWFNIDSDSMASCEGCTTYTPIYQIRSKESYQNMFSIEPGWDENNKVNIFRIITRNKLFKTDKEIKIGMTIKDLKKAYEFLDVSVEGELGIHIIVKDFNGSFGIELPKMIDWWTIDKSTIPDTLRINEIIIV